MDNLTIYNAVRAVPQDAQKTIGAGRLKGKTDINPMWRIKALTEQFGPCGIGWRYVISRQWLEAGANDEVSAFCNIALYVKVAGEWSEAIPGTGGSAFVAAESKGLYTSDECYKMALTDAISVACKALGFGADIYWSADRTKYDRAAGSINTAPNTAKTYKPMSDERFRQYVEGAARGQQYNGKDFRALWIKATNAGPDEVEMFDKAVFSFKINNDLQ